MKWFDVVKYIGGPAVRRKIMRAGRLNVPLVRAVVCTNQTIMEPSLRKIGISKTCVGKRRYEVQSYLMT